ncbi:hypothetical protein GUJ93_ZPchr0006g40954 [Zizania palustris]|uniref:peroxidase n=1 Tax=Zizania palustris TaxID=103762 RepID=A0A8J5W3D4_ZIZPA|nr:hypothetical protein GUJ93_ZPchr0006g40954 [Zizania palustris]
MAFIRGAAFASVALLLVVVASVAEGHRPELTERYYDKTCPNAQNIVRAVMERRVAGYKRMAPAILRLFFHDCFAYGCDGSVLLQNPESSDDERDVEANKSLDGFDVIDNIKSELEHNCPATVSCADILAIASRDAVAMLGGPTWSVLLGRKDSRFAHNNATYQLPSPTGHLDELLEVFQDHGLDERDLTALSGAHTIGMAHSCENFNDRIKHEDAEDIDPYFAAKLQHSCDQNDKCPVYFDEQTPMKFDNAYYQNLLNKRGLLTSDQALYTPGSWAGELVSIYANNQKAFFADFKTSMVKMGNLSPPDWMPTEVRLKCSMANY